MINKPTTLVPNMMNTHNGSMSQSVGPLMKQATENRSMQSQAIIAANQNKHKY